MHHLADYFCDADQTWVNDDDNHHVSEAKGWACTLFQQGVVIAFRSAVMCKAFMQVWVQP